MTALQPIAKSSAASEVVKPIMMVGRYALFEEIAQGGFASIHLGRTLGSAGFARTVAIKRLHRQYAKDPEVSAMFLDEARLVARIRHPNVLPTLDLIDDAEELFLIMEYVEGVSLRMLHREALARKRRIPLGIALRILCGALRGLHAAHEARDEQGELLHVIHRDVSPENILVGVDGHARLLDFGVARALGQFHSTRDGEVKGKLQYMTPEQVRGEILTRRSDIFSVSVVLWEVMTGQSLFGSKTIAGIAHDLVNRDIPPPSEVAGTPKKLDGIVMQGLERDPEARWATADKMAQALEALGDLSSEQAVARYVQQAGADKLRTRSAQVGRVESAQLPRMSMDSESIVRLSQVPVLDEETADGAHAEEILEAERALARESQSELPPEDQQEKGEATPDAHSLHLRDERRPAVVGGAFVAALFAIWLLWPNAVAPATAKTSVVSEAVRAISAVMMADNQERRSDADAPEGAEDAAASEPETPAAAAEPAVDAELAPTAKPVRAPRPAPALEPPPAKPRPRPSPPRKGSSGLYGRE